MFFAKTPNIEYDKKPLVFPFSEQEYTLAKNFFRRFKISETSYNSVVYFNKYTMTDQDRFDTIADKFYQNPDFDWIIMITNNIINPYFDAPIKNSELYNFVERKYGTPDGIHHYETTTVKNSLGEEIQKSGLFVDEVFHNTQHKFYDRGTKLMITKSGNAISIPVSFYEYELKLNEDRREIYILRPTYIQKFISEFENLLQYKPSSSYIDRNTKKSGV